MITNPELKTRCVPFVFSRQELPSSKEGFSFQRVAKMLRKKALKIVKFFFLPSKWKLNYFPRVMSEIPSGVDSFAEFGSSMKVTARTRLA